MTCNCSMPGECSSWPLEVAHQIALHDTQLLQVVVFALGPGTLQEDLDALLAAFTTISGTMSSSNSCHRQLTSLGVDLLPMPLSPGLTPRAAFFAAKEM